MTDIPGRQPADAESLGKRNDRAVDKAETEILVSPINLHRAGELAQRRRHVGKGAASDVLHEDLHRSALVAKEVIDFGEDETRNVAGASAINRVTK